MSAAGPSDYALRISSSPVEISPKHIVSTIAYNGQFPGPLLRFKEGQPVTVEIHNDTDTPEQLHWHGQFLSKDVDGAAEEGTPFIPAHGNNHLLGAALSAFKASARDGRVTHGSPGKSGCRQQVSDRAGAF